MVAEYLGAGREPDSIPVNEFFTHSEIDFTCGRYIRIDGVYYAYLLVTVTAGSVEELEWKCAEMKKLLLSQDMNVQPCSFCQEQAFLSSLTLVSLEKHLFERSKRNVLTLGAVSRHEKEQIYSREAADLLRDISMYRVVKGGQLLRLYASKEAKIKNLLSYLVKQWRIIQEGDAYFASPGCVSRVDKSLMSALWVLTDFADRVEYHSTGDFLTQKSSLSQYAREHPMPQFKHCVVFFSNIYNRELPTRRVRDYDNLELKRLLDVAASFMLVDDSGLWCDAYHTTELGETDCTRISIMDSGRFADWLKGREKVLDSIADL